MKLAVIFEVPDSGDYAHIATRLVEHHDFAKQQAPTTHWSFDLAMRPVGTVAVDVDQTLADAARMAHQEVDQDHPWIPGAVFRNDPRMKPLLLAFLSALLAKETG